MLSRRSVGQILAGVAALALSGKPAPAREKLEKLRRTAAEAMRRVARDEQSRFGYDPCEWEYVDWHGKLGSVVGLGGTWSAIGDFKDNFKPDARATEFCLGR